MSNKGSCDGQFVRVFNLARFLAERGKDGAELEDINKEIYNDYDIKSEAFRKIFLRDRNTLKEIYLYSGNNSSEPDITVVRKGKRYYIEGAYSFLMPMKISDAEVLALATGVKLAGHFVKPLNQSAKSLWDKLVKHISAASMAKGERLSDAISLAMPVSGTGEKDDVFHKTISAIEDKKVLRVHQYEDSKGRKISCSISPYALYFKYHAWYLLGTSPEIDPKQPTVFRLNRMNMVEVLSDVNFIELSCSPEELKDNIERDYHPADPEKSHSIKLRITGPFAQAVMETVWFKGEKKTKCSDREVLYEVSLKGLERIVLWIMRSLDCVEVLEPKELRDEIDKRVNQYLKRRKS